MGILKWGRSQRSRVSPLASRRRYLSPLGDSFLVLFAYFLSFPSLCHCGLSLETATGLFSCSMYSGADPHSLLSPSTFFARKVMLNCCQMACSLLCHHHLCHHFLHTGVSLQSNLPAFDAKKNGFLGCPGMLCL